MKTISSKQLVAILESTPDERRAAEEKFKRIILRTEGMPENWLSEGVKSGELLTQTVSLDGEPKIVIWYFVTRDGRLVGDSAQALTDDHCPGLVFQGLDLIAAAHGCHAIEFRTQRAGLLKLSEEFGYSATSVNLFKTL